jgi:predicted MPP superfamily phosphohydrolase
VQLPTYVKDVVHSSHAAETIKHKLHPLIGVFEMLDNEDYYGDQIRNPDDPIVKQALTRT